jgi:hypothetical protein
MALWLPIPPNWPNDGDVCYVRRCGWPSQPFTATWDGLAGVFVEYDTGLEIPWYDIQRWYLSSHTTPPTSITVSGSLTPDATGTYTLRGFYYGQPFYQQASNTYFVWYTTYSGGYWIITAGIGNAGALRWSTIAAGTPQDLLNTYDPYSGASGTATVS